MSKKYWTRQNKIDDFLIYMWLFHLKKKKYLPFAS